MARALVTGGCGFIGSHLVEALLGAGHSVRILDNLSTGSEDNLRAVLRHCELLHGSVTDPYCVRTAVADRDWVFHLAALPSVQRSLEDPLTTHEVCATGTLRVLEESRKAGVRRLIYAASSSAYGDSPGILRRESDRCYPLSPYAAAKLAGEHYCRSYSCALGLETVRLRLFNVFGPRQDPHSSYAGVVARFIAALCQGEVPVIHGDGRQSRDFTYVEDAVQAFLLATRAPAAAGEIYNIGAGGRTSIQKLLRTLGQLLGRNVRPEYASQRGGDVRHSQADITRVRQDMGYEPRISLCEGLRRTLAAYQATHPAADYTLES